MIDIHCHILPNVDDGSPHVRKSVDMARHAANEGITHIVATPHHRNGTYVNVRSDIIRAVQDLNATLHAEQIPVTILPGQETRINGQMVEEYENGDLLTINDTNRYVFLELPSNDVPNYIKQLIFDFNLKGITPIIVHPERNHALMEKPDQLYQLVNDGVLTQVTAASVIGRFGKKIKEFSLQLIDASLTHFIASDAHNLSSRSFHLRAAYDMITSEFDQLLCEELKENAERLIQGEDVYVHPPQKVKRRRRLFGLF